MSGQRFTLQGNPDFSSDDQVGYAGYASLPLTKLRADRHRILDLSQGRALLPRHRRASSERRSYERWQRGNLCCHACSRHYTGTSGAAECGEVGPGYTPIVCRVANLNGGDGDNFSLQCVDGDTGLRTTKELRCSGGNSLLFGR